MARSIKNDVALVDAAPRPEIWKRSYREFTLNICYLAANNQRPEQIASIMRIPLRRVKRILGTARARKEVAELSFRISGESPDKAFARLVPETIQVQAEIMRDPREKGAVRIMAANAIQDRALGKPKQQVDINHKSSIRQVLEILQSGVSAEAPAIPVQGRPIVELEAPEDEVPTEFPDVQESADSLPLTETAARDDVDAWLAENL